MIDTTTLRAGPPEWGSVVPPTPGRYVYSGFKIPVAFTLEGEGWTLGGPPGENNFFIGGGDQRIILVIAGHLTVEKWIEAVLAKDIEASEPEPVEVSGAPGMVITEVRLPAGASEQHTVTLLDWGLDQWVLASGFVERVYVVHVDGSSVAFYVEAPEALFADFAVLADEVIRSFEWNP